MRKILKEWADEWLETPVGGPALSAGFDKLAGEFIKASDNAKRLRKTVAKAEEVTTPLQMPAGSFCLMFNMSKQAKKFNEWAAAENMESAALPPGWIVAPGGRVNGTRNAPYRRSVFLPMGPAMKEKDIADVARVLQKLL
jgi:dTDP-4-amino-4,6-dideoxygalactose transaminase